RKGSSLRPAAPAGGSITITSAPSAARMPPASIVSGAEISSTRISSSIGPLLPAAGPRREVANDAGLELAARGFEVEGGRIEQALNRQAAQRADDNRGLRGRVRVAANLARRNSLLDHRADRIAKIRVGGGQVAPNLGDGSERLA